MRARSTWVYRDGRRRRRGDEVSADLARLLRKIERPASRAAFAEHEDALVTCGELEAALVDAGHPSARLVAQETDALADAALGRTYDPTLHALRVERMAMPAEVTTSTQEGCAFYALHPSSYARAVRDIGSCDRALVVGIRTIGATLSATVGAALRARGVLTTRFTVRPHGHPYDRRLDLGPVEAELLARARDDGARILIVDEGPGLSGSTFLAVAERFGLEGIADDRILLVASRSFDPAALGARDAPARYARFRVVVAPVGDDGPTDGVCVSAGGWRRYAFPAPAAWPPVFAQAERRKHLVDAGSRLVKFEGLGATARAALGRARTLADEGFCAAMREEGGGYASTPWEGAPSSPGDLDAAALARIAAYCAARPVLCPSYETPVDLGPIVRKNLGALGFDDVPEPALEVVRPAVVDGRMAPHEWLRQPGGSLLKCDAIAHGDDHFFPGPTDVAWDLAGTIVEWRLSGAACARLLDAYARASADDASRRIHGWTVAYATFRAALTLLALSQCHCEDERRRLRRDLRRYRAEIVSRSTPRPGG